MQATVFGVQHAAIEMEMSAPRCVILDLTLPTATTRYAA
jgi:hypothetical protein